jgi:invasion protein IalB
MNFKYNIVLGLMLATGATATLAADAKKPVAAETKAPEGLPGGATSLQETYDDWAVVCATQQSGRSCAMQQEQRAQQTGQRVLAVELRPAGTGAEGAMVLPFGLALQSGASVQVDEGTAGAAMSFSTCLPAGCVVPVKFDSKMLDGLRKGTALKIKVMPEGGGDAIQLSVSLKGFSAAFDRTAALLK